MATQAGVGISHHRNPDVAGREAAEAALKKAEIDKPDFVFVFATVAYHQEKLLRAIRAATGSAPLAGCSGSGIITRGEVDESNFSVSVMAIKSDEVLFNNAIVGEIKQAPETAGRNLARQVKDHIGAETKALFLFTDGIEMNFDRFKKGLEESLSLDRRLPMVGGLAGDAMEWKQTYQYCDDKILSGGIVCTAVSGKIELITGIDAGASVPVGTTHTITKCEGNVIHEIDNVRATDWLSAYVATDKGFKNWSLTSIVSLIFAFKAKGDLKKELGEYFVRGVPNKDDEAGTINMFTEVQEGTEFWLTRRDAKTILDGAAALGDRVSKKLEGRRPKLVLQFDCAGRGKIMLPEETRDKVVTSLQERVGGDVPWMGFYTFGEIGPIAGESYFHNYTVVLAVIA